MHIAMAELTAQQIQELVHRITGLEQMNQQLQTQQTTAQNTVALLSQQLNHAQQGSTQGVTRPREGMTDRKFFSTLPRYTGKVEDFDDWHFKMKQFLESEAEFLPFMMWVDQQAAHVSEDKLAHYDQQEGLALNTEWLNQQLHRVLSLNLDGPALAVVKNLAEEANHLGATGQRMAGLVARVFNPKRAGKYADAMQFIAGWESAVRQFERGAKTTLIDYLKIYGLKQVVPGELEKDMNRQTSTLSTYDEFKKYAMDQVALRKEPHFTGTVSTA